MNSSFFMRTAVVLLGTWFFFSPAAAQDRATVEDFSVHLFMIEKGELSPDVTKEPGFHSWNFSAHGEKSELGQFHGYLISLRFVSPREVFAKGPQARIELRDIHKKGRVVRKLTVSNVYVGTGIPAHRALFIDGLDCTSVEIVVVSHGKRIVKKLPLECGE